MPMEKTFRPAEAEPRIYADWEARGCFAAGAGAAEDAAPFCVMIPPPNVTGSLHIGHAFNNTLQDILVRWHRMRGSDTLWQPGQDHAGIATQMVVERELAQTNRRRTDMSRDDFVDLVWQQKERSGGTIIDQLKRLGASCDWSRNAFTMSGAPGDTRTGHENSPDFHAAVMKAFVDLYDRGIIYRGKRLVNWDPHFETAISDLEVENVEVDGHMWHFRYPLASGETYDYVERDVDGRETLRETRDWISIATTRPETMLGDGAVAVHPSDERYAPIVGKLCEIPVGPKDQRRLIPIITDEYPDPSFGSGAVKITGAHDFNDYAVAQRNGIPLYVLLDTKGALRTDGLDYAASAARATELARALAGGTGGADTAGSEAPDVAEVNLVPNAYRGLDRFEARARIVADITAEGLAVMVPSTDLRLGRTATPLAPEEGGAARADTLVPLIEPKVITQPFGDRSKVVIEPMLTDQWFVDTKRIVQPAIDAVRSGAVKIIPEQHEKVYFHWLENIEPWCISRQLWWGHRVPVWYMFAITTVEAQAKFNGLKTVPKQLKDQIVLGMDDQGDSEIYVSFCAPTQEDAVILARKYLQKRTTELQIDVNSKPVHYFSEFSDALRYIPQGSLEGIDFLPIWRDPDVLDTWFSSGLWPQGTLGWPADTPELQKYFPTSTLVTGFDIIFFWVARMMMMSHATTGKNPFDTVYVHALVRDAQGKKMSKSLGNVIDPLELIDQYGADALRFTLTSMAAMGRDLKLSTDRVAGYRNFGTKIWNAFRFAEMNGVFETAPPARPEPSLTVNRWIMGEVARTREAVDAALEGYRFNDAANTLYAFVWGRVCDWYVELAKPVFAGDDAAAIAETRAVVGWVLERCLLLLHPIMPFITEDLWRSTGHDGPLMLARWPEDTADALADPAADAELEWVIALIEAVRSARGEMGVPAALTVPLIQMELDDAGRDAWSRNAALIRRLARVDSLTEAAVAPKGSVTLPVRGGAFALPLAGLIDVDAERARLDKSLGKLDKDLRSLDGRLKNPKFVASAPDEVVAETRALASDKTEERARIAAALNRLAEMSI